MGTHGTPNHSIEKTKLQSFNPRDPEMEMLLRGLLHELRNPLSSILTAATLLQDSPLPDAPEMDAESQMLLDVVKKESLRLNHILTEFAGYIKLPPPHPANFDLAQTTRAAVRELQRTGVLPTLIEVQDELPATLNAWGDESQIRIALAHILRNAAEAMPQGGTLQLSQSPAPGQNDEAENVGLCITDSGQGFTAESHDRAFQPFYSSKEHSIGLGLSSVRSLIEAADGQVWLEPNSQSPAPRKPSTPRAFQPTSSFSVCFQLPRAKS